MGRLDLADKYRDEDATERRRFSRRFMNALQGRRKTDKDLSRPRSSAEEHHFPKV